MLDPRMDPAHRRQRSGDAQGGGPVVVHGQPRPPRPVGRAAPLPLGLHILTLGPDGLPLQRRPVVGVLPGLLPQVALAVEPLDRRGGRVGAEEHLRHERSPLRGQRAAPVPEAAHETPGHLGPVQRPQHLTAHVDRRAGQSGHRARLSFTDAQPEPDLGDAQALRLRPPTAPLRGGQLLDAAEPLLRQQRSTRRRDELVRHLQQATLGPGARRRHLPELGQQRSTPLPLPGRALLVVLVRCSPVPRWIGHRASPPPRASEPSRRWPVFRTSV